MRNTHRSMSRLLGARVTVNAFMCSAQHTHTHTQRERELSNFFAFKILLWQEGNKAEPRDLNSIFAYGNSLNFCLLIGEQVHVRGVKSDGTAYD
jgi:hypothetical protein